MSDDPHNINAEGGDQATSEANQDIPLDFSLFDAPPATKPVEDTKLPTQIIEKDTNENDPEAVFRRLKNGAVGPSPNDFARDLVNNYSDLNNTERQDEITSRWLAENSDRAREVDQKARSEWHESYGNSRGEGSTLTQNSEFKAKTALLARPEAIATEETRIVLNTGEQIAAEIVKLLQAREDLTKFKESDYQPSRREREKSTSPFAGGGVEKRDQDLWDQTDDEWKTLSQEQQKEILETYARAPRERLKALGETLLEKKQPIGIVAIIASEQVGQSNLAAIKALAIENQEIPWVGYGRQIGELHTNGGSLKLPTVGASGSVEIGIKPGLKVDSIQDRNDTGKRLPPLSTRIPGQIAVVNQMLKVK